MTFIGTYRWYLLSILVAAVIIVATSYSYEISNDGLLDLTTNSIKGLLSNPDFLIYLAVGFTAQMIDGSLGMAYGVSSTSFLMSAGVSPAIASTSVHVAEVFTTGVSGFTHWKFGNVDKVMFKKLI